MIKKILIDNKSSVNILFYVAFSKINLADQLKQVGTPLVRFLESSVAIEEKITLLVTAG